MRLSHRRSLIITIATAFGLVAMGRLQLLKPINLVWDYTTTPIRASFRWVGERLGGLGSSVAEIRHLQADNAKLSQQVNQLKVQLANDAEIKQQNEILRRQLAIGGSAPQQLMAAAVIGYQPDDFRQFITIAKGAHDGVKDGQAVVSDGTMIGTISQTSATTSKVFLINDPNFKIDGMDQSTRALGTVQGQLGNGLVMDKIAQNDSVKPGDMIVTSGLGGQLPKGLLIGEVQSVDQRDNQVFQTAQLNFPIKVNKLELVFVVVGQ